MDIYFWELLYQEMNDGKADVSNPTKIEEDTFT
jgi:hypothetical protein